MVASSADRGGAPIQTDILFYLVAVPAVLILGLSKGGFAGVGMVCTPLVALVVGPVEAAGILLPILVAQDAVAVWMYRGEWRTDILLGLVPGGAVGVLLAYLLAAVTPEAWIALVLGMISVGFAAYQLWPGRARTLADAPRPNLFLGGLSGVASGFTSGVAHAGTPPFQFYVLPQKLAQRTYIATSAAFFACLNLLKVPAFAALGQFSAGHLMTAVTLLPLSLFTSWLGVRLVRLINPERFALLVNGLLVAVGIFLILDGAADLTARP